MYRYKNAIKSPSGRIFFVHILFYDCMLVHRWPKNIKSIHFLLTFFHIFYIFMLWNVLWNVYNLITLNECERAIRPFMFLIYFYHSTPCSWSECNFFWWNRCIHDMNWVPKIYTRFQLQLRFHLISIDIESDIWSILTG